MLLAPPDNKNSTAHSAARLPSFSAWLKSQQEVKAENVDLAIREGDVMAE
jgi:hypothetical protein